MRKTIALTVLATVLLLAATLFALLHGETSRRWITTRLVQPKPPESIEPLSLRHVLLSERTRALHANDLPTAARLSGLLAHEARLRALATHKAWLTRRDPNTKLYPQSPDRPEWNFRNTAADFFSFHLHAGLLLNPEAMPSLNETLAAEAKLRTPEGLCTPVLSATGEPVDVDHDELLFGSSEYAKDGLLSLYERHGRDLFGPPLLKIVDAVIAQSKHQSRFGPLPGTGAEINGNMLQLCGRLSYAEDRSDYADFAARIADAMIQQAMPANNGLPPKFYDYAGNKVIDGTLKLKDHGNEAILGLAEAYAMAVDRSKTDSTWRDRAQRWQEPVAKMFEIILKHGVNADGLLVGTMDPSPPRPSQDKLCDNWGYVLSGAILFTDAARRHGQMDKARIEAIESAIDRIARATFARTPGVPWSDSMDSDADAIESAIYIAAYRHALRDEALAWTDRHVAAFFESQDADGTAVGHYLDGNFIRTSLLYADVRSGGWRADPWREDLLIGFAESGHGKAVLTIHCTEPYTGALRPPEPRHRTVMKLPWNWARLNSWPEWYAVDADVQIENTSLGSTGGAITPTNTPGQLTLNLPANGSATISFARHRVASSR